jgi:hypothetical protein
MVFRVYDTGANHLIGVFETEHEAMETAEDLAVGLQRPDGSFGPTLSGREMVARAEELVVRPDHRERRRGEVIAGRIRTIGNPGRRIVPKVAAGVQWAANRVDRKRLDAPSRRRIDR